MTNLKGLYVRTWSILLPTQCSSDYGFILPTYLVKGQDDEPDLGVRLLQLVLIKALSGFLNQVCWSPSALTLTWAEATDPISSGSLAAELPPPVPFSLGQVG